MISRDKFKSIADSFKDKQVMIIGDMMLDRYYYGQTANGTVDGAWTYWIGNEHISSLYATASDAVGTSNAGKACRVLASTEASAYIALNAEL